MMRRAGRPGGPGVNIRRSTICGHTRNMRKYTNTPLFDKDMYDSFERKIKVITLDSKDNRLKLLKLVDDLHEIHGMVVDDILFDCHGFEPTPKQQQRCVESKHICKRVTHLLKMATNALSDLEGSGDVTSSKPVSWRKPSSRRSPLSKE